MSEDVTRGLPADLASVLRDQSVIISQDAAIFELIAAWAKAPTSTASAEVPAETTHNDMLELLRNALVEARPYVFNQTQSTQPWRAEMAADVLSRVDTALLRFLDPKQFSSYWKFRERYCED